MKLLLLSVYCFQCHHSTLKFTTDIISAAIQRTIFPVWVLQVFSSVGIWEHQGQQKAFPRCICIAFYLLPTHSLLTSNPGWEVLLHKCERLLMEEQCFWCTEAPRYWYYLLIMLTSEQLMLLYSRVLNLTHGGLPETDSLCTCFFMFSYIFTSSSP